MSFNKSIVKSPLQNVDHFDQAWPKCRQFADILKLIFKAENIYDSNFRAVCFAGSNWQYPFIQWTGAEQTTCHHTIHWWHSSLAYDKHYNHGYHSLIPYPSLSKSMQLASLGLIDNICSYNWLVPNRHYAITRANETQYWRMISVITMDYTHWFLISLLLLHALTNDPLLLIEQYRFI